MQIVPVLDLMGGNVVHGRGGRRADYRPIRSPLGHAGDAAGMARRLVRISGAQCLYLADLDAIMGKAVQTGLIDAICKAVPHVDIWLDAGFVTPEQAAARPLRTRPVFGTESLADAVAALPADAVLSLDFAASGYLGPGMWLAQPQRWPDRVVCMTLAAVGSDGGPNFETLAGIVSLAGQRAVFAAGGVRHAGDLAKLAAARCAGALVATALHDGRIAGAG